MEWFDRLYTTPFIWEEGKWKVALLSPNERGEYERKLTWIEWTFLGYLLVREFVHGRIHD